MITACPNRERVFCASVIRGILLVFLFLLTDLAVFAQAQSIQDQSIPKQTTGLSLEVDDELSDEAKKRIASFILQRRQDKTQRESNQQVEADKEALATMMQRLDQLKLGNRAEEVYTSLYFDTSPGNDFSFPEDTHDFCRVTFDETARQDYTLDASILAGASLSVQLEWTPPASGFSDYDLYLFDRDGRPAGDPTGLFPNGNVSNAYQIDNSDLIEIASVQNDGTDEALFIVVDRFRGQMGNDLTITVSGDDGTFSVLEYIGAEEFFHINAVTDEVLGVLSEGAEINLDEIGSPRPNFNVQLQTDGCAQSIQFVLIDALSGEPVYELIDNDLPYALFDDTDGDYNAGDLADGSYTLIATPFSESDGQGVAGDEESVSFQIVSAEDDTVRVVDFSLIDAATDQPVGAFDPINEGDLIDLVALHDAGLDINRLNIQANVVDENGIIATMVFDGSIVLEAGGNQVLSNIDDAADYSLFGDDNAGDFSDATLPTGSYTLSADPTGINGVDPALLIGASVNFTVIGPRITSYSLIDADLNDPIDGFNPIEEGAIIDLSSLSATEFNIRANLADYTPPTIDYASLTLLRGSIQVVDRIENFRPYSVFGDCNLALGCSMDLDPPFASDAEKPNYSSWVSPVDDSYTLTGVPFVDDSFQYSENVLNFTITGSAANQADASSGTTELGPNFPNPFNPVTTIRFEIPEDAFVRLAVFDLLGREIKTLVDGTLSAGAHEVPFDAQQLSSGMYLYRLETPGNVQVRTMTLLK